jgi:hypothetical protein
MISRVNRFLVGALVGLTAVARASAQIAPGDKIVKLPPPPAPVLAAADQTVRTIYPLVRFDLPPNTVAIRVSRQQAGGTILLTPTDVPIASVNKVTMIDHTYYVWLDNTLTALGTYSYSVSAVQSDGQVGVSSWLPFTPQIYEAQTVAVQKTSPYSAVVTFSSSTPLPARTYKLYGTGIVPYGLQATTTDKVGRSWAVQVGNLAAGTYNWIVRAEFDPGIRTSGVPVSVKLP